MEGYTLSLKTEFHVSLVCVGKITKKHNITIPNFIDRVTADFRDFAERFPIDLERYHNEFRLASQGERRSVIAMCDISNLDKFFDLLNQKYDLSLEYPPTHVTLYTLQPNLGIYLTDSSDFERLTKTVEVPILIQQE